MEKYIAGCKNYDKMLIKAITRYQQNYQNLSGYQSRTDINTTMII